MDDRKFDALVRDLGSSTSRRRALSALAAGVLGYGMWRRGAAAEGEVTAEGCRIRRCKKQALGSKCLDSRGRADNHKCCAGLKCQNRRGVCVFKNGHGDPGDYCDNNRDCKNGNCCRKNQCVPETCNVC